MLIKNGKIVTETTIFQGDIRIEKGVIDEVAEHIEANANEEVLDVAGKWILPGGIDVHTHFDMPSDVGMTSDDFYSGTKAAIVGGTTTIIDFAEPELETPLEQGLTVWNQKSKGKSFCDYGFHMTISHWDESMSTQIEKLVQKGITSFKAYTAYQDSIGVTLNELEKIMKAVSQHGGILCVHSEHHEELEKRKKYLKNIDATNLLFHPKSRPNVVEEIAINEVIEMAKKLDAFVYIVHISTKEGAHAVQKAKGSGVKVYGETCPHYLILDESKYHLKGFESAKFVMSPPLRSKEDNAALWESVKNHTIDIIATDHCSFDYETQKKLGVLDFTKIPNGIPSVEHRLLLVYEYGFKQGLDMKDIVELTSTNPAKIFGMYPQKGVLQVGSDADIIIVGEGETHTISAKTQCQNVDYTPYEGVKTKWQIEQVYLRGELIVRHNQIEHAIPRGEFIPRKGGL